VLRRFFSWQVWVHPAQIVRLCLITSRVRLNCAGVRPAAGEDVMITIDEFKKTELKIARIKEVNDHPNADRLYVLQVEVGEATKQIVAGIKRAYTKEELVGKLVVIVDNLEPAVLRGVESQGMLLATQDDVTLAVLSPEKAVKTGSIVK